MANALQTLSEAGNYWVVNWELVHYFGRFEEAIILGYLCSMQVYWAKHNSLLGGMFFCTIKTMEEQTTIKQKKQMQAIDNLVKLGLIETKNMGVPPHRCFKVCPDVIEDFLK